MKKENILLIVIIGLSLISFTSALTCTGTMLGTYKVNTNITLRQTCDTCTYVTLNTITSPDSIITTVDKNMTKIGVDYDYTVIVNKAGDYYYSVFGDKDGAIATENFCFVAEQKGNSGLDPLVIIGIIVLLIGFNIFVMYRRNKFIGNLIFMGLGMLTLYTFAGQGGGITTIIGAGLLIGGVINLIFDLLSPSKY
jgi:hypothetical protein